MKCGQMEIFAGRRSESFVLSSRKTDENNDVTRSVFDMKRKVRAIFISSETKTKRPNKSGMRKKGRKEDKRMRGRKPRLLARDPGTVTLRVIHYPPPPGCPFGPKGSRAKERCGNSGRCSSRTPALERVVS